MTTTKATASAGSGSSRRSSDPTPELDRVTELGVSIVQSFQRDSDRLSQWMAHHVAELMETAAKDRVRARRDAAADRAADLIIRLWRHRDQWPRGWPPGDLNTLLDRLRDLEATPAWQRRLRPTEPSEPGWSAALAELDRLAQLERELVFSAGLMSTGSDEVEQWRRASARAGEEDELLEQLERNMEAARRKLTPRRDPRLSEDDESPERDPKELQQSALDALLDLADRRAELLESIAVGQGLTIKPRRRSRRAKQSTKRR